MDINDTMKAKMDEIEQTKAARELLFADFEANKKQIAVMYYEIESLQLEYFLLKRAQLAELKMKAGPDILEHIEGIAKVNEHCLHITRGKLIEAGFEVADYVEVAEHMGRRILQFESEEGYRVDFGTMRSKLVPNLYEAKRLID